MYVEQEDACTFSEGEEVTFLRWGNFFIDEIRKENGLVIDMKGNGVIGVFSFILKNVLNIVSYL